MIWIPEGPVPGETRREAKERRARNSVGYAEREKEHERQVRNRQAREWRAWKKQGRVAYIHTLHGDALKREQEREAQRELAIRLVDIGYKALAMDYHPDKGGSHETMTRLNRARDHLKKMV